MSAMSWTATRMPVAGRDLEQHPVVQAGEPAGPDGKRRREERGGRSAWPSTLPAAPSRDYGAIRQPAGGKPTLAPTVPSTPARRVAGRAGRRSHSARVKPTPCDLARAPCQRIRPQVPQRGGPAPAGRPHGARRRRGMNIGTAVVPLVPGSVPSACPSATSKSRTVPSSAPAASVAESGVNATRECCRRRRRNRSSPASTSPWSRGACGAGGRRRRAAGRRGSSARTGDAAGRAQDADAAARADVPDLLAVLHDSAIERLDGEPAAVRAELPVAGAAAAAEPQRSAEPVPARQRPQDGRACSPLVVARQPAVGAHARRPDRVAGRLAGNAGVRVRVPAQPPHDRRPVGVDHRDPPVVGADDHRMRAGHERDALDGVGADDPDVVDDAHGRAPAQRAHVDQVERARSPRPCASTVRDGSRARTRSAADADGARARPRRAGTLNLIDMRSLRRRAAVRVVDDIGVVGPDAVEGIAFVPGTHTVVVGTDYGRVAVVDADRAAVVRWLRGHPDADPSVPGKPAGNTVWTAGVSADGRLVATTSGDGTTILWSLPGWHAARRSVAVPPRRRRQRRAAQPGRPLARRPDAQSRSRAGPRGDLGRPHAPPRPRPEPARRRLQYARSSPDGRLLAVAGLQRRMHLYSTATWKPANYDFVVDGGSLVRWRSPPTPRHSPRAQTTAPCGSSTSPTGRRSARSRARAARPPCRCSCHGGAGLRAAGQQERVRHAVGPAAGCAGTARVQDRRASASRVPSGTRALPGPRLYGPAC